MKASLINTPSIILASTSSYRKRLIEEWLGVSVVTQAPTFSEEKFKRDGGGEKLNPYQLSQKLSNLKGKSIEEKNQGDVVVISGDQVCYGKGKIWDKPVTRERAIETLSQLQGNAHELITTISLFYKGEILEHQDITTLTMIKLSRVEIETYVDFANPLDCGGSYKIEMGGMSLFSSIKTEDFSSIQGVPLLFVRNALQKWNVKFWSKM